MAYKSEHVEKLTYDKGSFAYIFHIDNFHHCPYSIVSLSCGDRRVHFAL